jgi:hypothetical protein
LQERNRYLPNQRQPDDPGCIEPEMFLPAIPPRVKQSNEFFAFRVNRADVGSFRAIAPGTGKSQI